MPISVAFDHTPVASPAASRSFLPTSISIQGRLLIMIKQCRIAFGDALHFFHVKTLAAADPVQAFLQNADRQMTTRLIGVTLPANRAAIDNPQILIGRLHPAARSDR